MDKRKFGLKKIWTKENLDKRKFGLKKNWTKENLDKRKVGQKNICTQDMIRKERRESSIAAVSTAVRATGSQTNVKKD